MPAIAFWLYVILAVGAVALYLLLPRSGATLRGAGTLIGLAALAGLIAVGVEQFGAASEADLVFCLFASIAVVSAVCVIIQTKAVYSALYFILVILSSAGVVLQLDAEFLAVALIIIYGGAILVTYIFVIMLAQQASLPLYDRRARNPLAACFSGFLLMATIGGVMADEPGGPELALESAQSAPAAVSVAEGNTTSVGALLMTRYITVLEIAGILLLLAMIGAIAIALKVFPKDADAPQVEYKPGEAGRMASPF